MTKDEGVVVTGVSARGYSKDNMQYGLQISAACRFSYVYLQINRGQWRV